MFEMKIVVEAGGVLAQFLTNFLGGAPAAPVQKTISSTPVPATKENNTIATGTGVDLEALRKLVTDVATSDKNKRPAIRTIFEAKNAKGASDLAVEYYEEVFAQLSAL